MLSVMSRDSLGTECSILPEKFTKVFSKNRNGFGTKSDIFKKVNAYIWDTIKLLPYPGQHLPKTWQTAIKQEKKVGDFEGSQQEE